MTSEAPPKADTCPQCGYAGVEGDRCPKCGVIVSVYRVWLETLRRGPTPRTGVSPAIPRPTTPAPSASPAGVSRLAFHGLGESLFGIHIVNVLLTLVTAGVYYFWGRVRVRRYLLSQTEFEGDRFAYHGTGGELLRGFLKAMLIFGVPLAAVNVVPGLLGGVDLETPARILTSAIVMVFVPVAMVGAHRYRLSRTSWRGIRFSFRGKTWEFVKLFVASTILTSLTFGFYYPVFQTRMRGFMVSHAYFGQRRFRFTGRGRDLIRPYLLAVLLTIPTLGLCWFWFLARKSRYFWEHTFFETARFRSTVTGRLLLNLTGGNFLLLLVTLGFAWPWVLVRNARFAFAYLRIEGGLDLAGIVQEPQTSVATGDALSSVLGLDVDLG